MGGYKPLHISSPETGLVQQRQEFLLPNDAYPQLQNAYVWRERLKRKKGYQLLGRLQRRVNVANALVAGSLNLISALSLEATSTITPGTINLVGSVDLSTYTDPAGDGILVATGGTGTGGSINYATGVISINAGAGETLTGTIEYNPGLPVMGIRTRERINALIDQTIFFDQKYAYIFNSTTGIFQEWIPGTTWNARNATVSAVDFFWSTNWWVSQTTIPGTATPLFTTDNDKLFWVTNDTGQYGNTSDPPRITDGTTWKPFWDDATPANSPWAQIDATTYLVNFRSMLPFRGRLVTFNTWEGPNATSAKNYSNRIRWSTIGNPFIPYDAGPPAKGSWRDDIRGQGGYLDIPTSEDIIAVGFVRDNLVIYCERSTWQLRYTGRSIAPFQIERVNSELGAEGPFSAVQFDTSLMGIGDKGIVECDSYKSERVDVKIPDFVFKFLSSNDAPFRVHGVRDFINRLAFWTIPLSAKYSAEIGLTSKIFPNQRLVYNYENDSWALFDDSLTTLGTFQPQTSRNWINTPIPWVKCNFSWIGSQISGEPFIVGGNQQGFVEYLDQLTVNDVSLYISNIVGQGISGSPITGTATVITCPNHNMRSDFVIEISGIPDGTPYDNLNGGIFGIDLGDENGLDKDNKFRLYKYNSASDQFDDPQLDVPSGDYIGGGLIKIRENFSIVSKKFNFMDEGQNIQFGYADVLMSATGDNQPGAISFYVYLDYNDDEPSNTLPQNEINDYSTQRNPDTFFNSVIPTNKPTLNNVGGSKFWHRVFCATRASFITLQYTFSNAQMAGEEQTKDVQIDAQILWIRKAGKITTI